MNSLYTILYYPFLEAIRSGSLILPCYKFILCRDMNFHASKRCYAESVKNNSSERFFVMRDKPSCIKVKCVLKRKLKKIDPVNEKSDYDVHTLYKNFAKSSADIIKHNNIFLFVGNDALNDFVSVWNSLLPTDKIISRDISWTDSIEGIHLDADKSGYANFHYDRENDIFKGEDNWLNVQVYWDFSTEIKYIMILDEGLNIKSCLSFIPYKNFICYNRIVPMEEWASLESYNNIDPDNILDTLRMITYVAVCQKMKERIATFSETFSKGQLVLNHKGMRIISKQPYPISVYL